jgi:hypothetical protein
VVLDHAGSGRDVVWPACGLHRDRVEVCHKEVPLLVIPEVEFATGIGGESTSFAAATSTGLYNSNPTKHLISDDTDRAGQCTSTANGTTGMHNNLISADPKQHTNVTANTCIAGQSTSDANDTAGLSTSTATGLYSANPNQHAITTASICHLNPRQAKQNLERKRGERKLVPSKRARGDIPRFGRGSGRACERLTRWSSPLEVGCLI